MNGIRFPLAAAEQSLYNGGVPSRPKRRPTRRAKRPAPSASSRAQHFLTNSEGQRRAIILDMNYYLKLLSELHTLRALAKQRGSAAGPSRGGRRSSR